MAFESTDLEAVYAEICRRQEEVGHLALVEFDDAEYEALLGQAKRIVRGCGRWRSKRQEQARLVFLAFTMAFVRHRKYASDNIFWPDFENVLGLNVMERRSLMMDDLLWSAYQEEGLELTHDDRGRRIVGTLTDEMHQAGAWVTQARRQFVEFFQWHYRHCPDEQITPHLLAIYREKTGARLQALDKVLPALSRDCQALARVIDHAIENGLYLTASQLDDYRRQVVAALGPEYDPARLRLIHDQRALIRLILELQNHYTPAQFKRELHARRGGFVRAPWGDRLNVHSALERWTPFAYGVYRVEGQEYRVVPHPRLRLEMLDEWHFERVVPWRGGRLLGYKKRSSFDVTIGRRTVGATRYVRSRGEEVYVWVGEVPTGQKLAIDGRLRPESAGAEWDVALRLTAAGNERPALCIPITRLMLYYPDRIFQPVHVWASTGYRYEDTLCEDGVQRFHLHRRLIIPLDIFDASVKVGVSVSDETVLCQTFEPEPHYLFSVVSCSQVRARELADFGDREYVLFTRDESPPQACSGVSVTRLPEPWGAYTVYQVTWEDADQSFELRVGTAHWAFERRREFAALFESNPPPPHLRLRPHQCLRFQDLSLRLYSTLDLTAIPLVLEVYDDDGLVGQVELSPHVSPADSRHFFDVTPAIWEEVNDLAAGQYGRYYLCFYSEEILLGEEVLSLMPSPSLEGWEGNAPQLETELLEVSIASPDCPVWNPDTQRTENRAAFRLRPRTHAERWPDYPALRRIVSEPVSTLASFPDLGETLEVVVHPRLFGFRLYLKRSEQTLAGRWRTSYQRLSQADYYHLKSTELHVFSAPHSRVELSVGVLVVWEGETDADGDLLLDSLECLHPACMGEETRVTVRSGGLRTEFIVRWAPLLQDLAVEDEEIVLRFNGPDDTSVRLWLRGPSGEAFWAQDVPCQGKEITARIPLPVQRPPLGYLVAGYVLSGGELRPAVKQVQVEGKSAVRIPSEWLREGVGFDSLKDLEALEEHYAMMVA
jgi:hypothetical protein